MQRGGDQARLAIAAVVGADDEIVGDGAELVLPEHQVLASKTHDRRGAVADLLEGAQLRVDRRDAQAAADEDDMADLGDVLRQAERTDEVLERVALLIAVAHFARGLAERLHHDGDGATVAVVIGDGQRDALGAVVKANHDEMAGLGRSRDIRRLDVPKKRRVRKTLPVNNRIHRSPLTKPST